jgi:hypothetical protein
LHDRLAGGNARPDFNNTDKAAIAMVVMRRELCD